MKKLTKEEFIIKSKLIHGDKYDYSLVEYINNNTKVKIKYNDIIYEQKPNSHLSKKCPENNIIKLTTEEFIKRAKLVHGDKYDYSLVEYINIMKKIKLIHNNIIYEQVANDHLNGHRPEVRHTTNDTIEFISKSKKIHGDKYDYSKVIYINQNEKIVIILDNKEYLQSPKQHIQGYMPEMLNYLSKEDFIERCKKIHDDKYDYSLVEYININSTIKIIFNNIIYEQIAYNHLCGHNPKILTPLSKGEGRIKFILDNNNIIYYQQKSYENCKNISTLPFDFYLPNYNLLIEFDGIQHYEIIKHFGGELGFEKRKKHDEIKNNYVKHNKIPLLRIPYYDFDKIEELIMDFIKSQNISS